MKLWTVQPVDVYNDIMSTGIYRCQKDKIQLPELIPYYDWMVKEMTKKIGQPPANVNYPVWAIHTEKWEHKKPDLRFLRGEFGKKGDHFACIEVDIPDKDVVLSDFDAWSIILVNGLITETRSESDELDALYDSLPDSEKEKMRLDNWKRVFDISVLKNDWTTRGKSIQATFWELKKEQICDVRFFEGSARQNR